MTQSKSPRLFHGARGQACEHKFEGYDSLADSATEGLCSACAAHLKNGGRFDITWFRGEFRHTVLDPGKVVAFVPSTEDGKVRPGVTARLHHDESAKLAGTWAEGDRIFYYQMMDLDGSIDGGYFNERTKEKVSVVH